MDSISIRGAQEHNLKNVDLDVPKNCLVAFTGVSGSGKSSLVFDTLYAESFRRFADASQIPIYVLGKNQWSKLKRPQFRSIRGLPPALGLSQRQGVASRTSTVGTISAVSDLLRVYFAAFGKIYCKSCDIPLATSDFNSIYEDIVLNYKDKNVTFIAQIAEKRKGAFKTEIEKLRQLGFSKLRINSKIYDLQNDYKAIAVDSKKLNTIEVLIDSFEIKDFKKQRIQRSIQQAIEHGMGLVKIECEGVDQKYNTKSTCPQCKESAPKIDPRYFSHSSLGKCLKCQGSGAAGDDLPNDLFPCTSCHGFRLSKENPVVKVTGITYQEIQEMNFTRLAEYISVKLSQDLQQDKAKIKVFSELSRLTQSAVALGIAHLTLNRSGSSLSPGDLQRLRLAALISNHLAGALYIIDEPCQGLTREEVIKLVGVLRQLVSSGASVIAVEHHPTFLSNCDKLITMGPGAGSQGGSVVSIFDHTQNKNEGKKEDQKEDQSEGKNQTSMTTASLDFSKINIRSCHSDLIKIKYNAMNLISGQAGTGKSSFVELCLLPALRHIGAKDISDDNEESEEGSASDFLLNKYCYFQIDSKNSNIPAKQYSYFRPGSMNKSSRRTVSQALEVIQPLRSLFARLPASQTLGLTESHFSWNSKLGQCEDCQGKGYKELPQKYTHPIQYECETCLGARLNSRSLIPRFKGYHFADIMQLSIEQALNVFENHRLVVSKLNRAQQFGLGYILLGQNMQSLSGGEMQRLVLTINLKRVKLEGFWFILMHPSTGLHKPDIINLGKLMDEMIAHGASFVVVDNREEFQQFASHRIEFT